VEKALTRSLRVEPLRESSTLPTSLAETFEHVFVILGTHPGHAIMDIEFKFSWGEREGLL
jgi:hypothetical protein